MYACYVHDANLGLKLAVFTFSPVFPYYFRSLCIGEFNYLGQYVDSKKEKKKIQHDAFE